MSKVLFGQSYYLRFDPKEWEGMKPYPPLGTLYAASYIRDRGYDVCFFDSMLTASEDEWARALDLHRTRPQPVLVGDAQTAGQLIRRLKAHAPNVARQPIGIGTDQIDGAIAVGLVDAHSPCGPHAVRL